MSLNDKLISWCPKRFTYFYRIISQPKSDYRPIEFVQTQQAIYIHQVNNQTNLKYVATMTQYFYLAYSTCCSTTSTPSLALVK